MIQEKGPGKELNHHNPLLKKPPLPPHTSSYQLERQRHVYVACQRAYVGVGGNRAELCLTPVQASVGRQWGGGSCFKQQPDLG